MYKKINAALFFFILMTINSLAQEAAIEKEAPDFSLTDSYGKVHALSEYKGSYVVLEWVNFECPFVKKHYNSGHMQMLQKKYTDKGVVWLTICSSAKGKQGNFSNDEINKRSKDHNASFTAYLIDDSGKVGKLFGAKTTPHMFIINPEGILIYAGGIDDKASTDLADIKTANNYVDEALTAAMNGKDFEHHVTKSYGCSVKY